MTYSDYNTRTRQLKNKVARSERIVARCLKALIFLALAFIVFICILMRHIHVH